jgi:hypothetical protein
VQPMVITRRSVESEWLDELPASDPRAKRSRGDLRRINWHMGNARIIARALLPATDEPANKAITELGTGDGDLLLKVARALGTSWSGTTATLLDRQPVVSEQTLAAFRRLNWVARIATRDAFDWCAMAEDRNPQIVVVNLFLHHFETAKLVRLLEGIERRSWFFAALEPRRSSLALLFSKMVGAIGCNAVTRHDAPASVRAGFSGTELSQLWPNPRLWSTTERSAGAFGHLFVARRKTSLP